MAPPPCDFPDLPHCSLGQMLLSLGVHSPLFIFESADRSVARCLYLSASLLRPGPPE